MERRVLVVDDDPDMGSFLAATLRAGGFETQILHSAPEALEVLRAGEFDVLLTDVQMSGMTGLELCERALAARPDVPVIVITAHGSLDAAVGAIRAGAYDFLTKPIKAEPLQIAVERAARHRALTDELKRLRDASTPQPFEGIVGASAALKAVFDVVSRVSTTDSSVLITGESGTGKEMIARALHQRSRRAGGPFVAVNCAAMPEALLESELFGHARGAFTDAKTARAGLFLQSAGGTLFLDEIGELPLTLQPKLLRALQERTVRPVGGDHEIRTDVRVLAATNRDLETAVEEGRFRQDLFYRVNVVHIDLPPLRARGNDVLMLAQAALSKAARAADRPVSGISSAAAQKLLAYDWPGNVRELQNAIESAVALTRYSEITADDLPERIREHTPTHILVAGDDPDEMPSMEEVERRYVLRVFQAVHGNKALAARVLGFDRKTLYRKLEKYGVGSDEK